MKICKDCNKFKEFIDFYKHKETKDGYMNICKNCSKLKSKLWSLNNKERIKEKCRSWYSNNKEKAKKVRKDWRLNNVDREKVNKKEYHLRNPDVAIKAKKTYKEENYLKYRETTKAYQIKNKAILTSNCAQYRAKKLNSTPKWLTKFDKDYIRHIYIQARELEKLDGIKRHVDHIVPLQGKNVSGLHVPWNLQILTAHENCAKHNRLLGGTP